MSVRVRFAPSPSGSLHLGNARTALFNWLFARRHLGAFILRIEDTDTERSVEGAERQILEDLAWLGLDWDEGPDAGGPVGPYRQSERVASYGRAAGDLIDAGVAYSCFCTPERLGEDRRTMKAEGRTPRYLGHCARIPPEESRMRVERGETAAVRLRLSGYPPVEDLLRGTVDFSSREPSDPVLLRRDGRPTYNFAVVVDDAAMGITHVLRGDDHLSNTPLQIRIYEALRLAPPRFAHLPTVLGPDGTPLSKRHGAVSLAETRRQGYPPEGVAGALMMLGWTPPSAGRGELPDLASAAAVFDLEKVNRAAGSFDRGRLDHLSTVVLSSLEPSERGRRGVGFVRPGGAGEGWSGDRLEWLGRLLDLWSGQVCRLEQYAGHARFVFDFDAALRAAPGEIAAELSSPATREVLGRFSEVLSETGPLADPGAFNDAARRAGERAGVRGRSLFHPVRLALTAAADGPELRRLAPLLDEGAALGPPGDVPSTLERIARVLEAFDGGEGA